MILFCYKIGYLSQAGGKKVVSLTPLNSTSEKTYVGKREQQELQYKECVESTDLAARFASALFLHPK